MYPLGSYVVKKGTGVCRVEETLTMDASGPGSSRLYYRLAPASDLKAKIFLPVDSQALRPVLTAREAEALLAEFPGLAPTAIDNEKLREQVYKTALKSTDPRQWACIFKTLRDRRAARASQGKKSTAMDDYYYRAAQELLTGELSVSTGRAAGDIASLLEEAPQPFPK